MLQRHGRRSELSRDKSDIDRSDVDVIVVPFNVIEHWVKNEWSKLFAVAVKSVESKSSQSAVVNLTRIYSLIFKSIYVSCSAGIKNSRSLWSTDAIGLYVVSIVSCTDVCTGFCANMSNSELSDNASAVMPTSRMQALWKDVSFYMLLPLLNSPRLFSALPLVRLRPCPLTLFRNLCAESLTFLRTTSRNFVSGSVMSVSMFRPAASASEPRSWHRARAMDVQTNATDHLEYCRLHDRAEWKVDYCILGLPRYHRDRAMLDVDSIKPTDP